MEASSLNHVLNDSEFQTNFNTTLSPTINSGDCSSKQCDERRKHLTDENQRLREKVPKFRLFIFSLRIPNLKFVKIIKKQSFQNEEDRLHMIKYEGKINLLIDTIHSMGEESKKNIRQIEEMSEEIEKKVVEVEAANITAERLQVKLFSILETLFFKIFKFQNLT